MVIYLVKNFAKWRNKYELWILLFQSTSWIDRFNLQKANISFAIKYVLQNLIDDLKNCYTDKLDLPISTYCFIDVCEIILTFKFWQVAEATIKDALVQLFVKHSEIFIATPDIPCLVLGHNTQHELVLALLVFLVMVILLIFFTQLQLKIKDLPYVK